MITPKWVKTKSQPIAIRNVIEFLTGVLLHPDCVGKAFDIGGLSILSYKEMLYRYAKNRGLKKLIITVPIMTPRLSSYWLYFVTSTSYPLAVNLVKSMKSEVIVKGDELHKILGIKLYSYDEAIKHFEKTDFGLSKSHQLECFYYLGDKENLMPDYNEETDYHIEKIEMSNHQFAKYEEVRNEERKRDKQKPGRKKKDELFSETTSSYRIFSRAYCNFVFPESISRPFPKENGLEDSIDTIGDEDDIDALTNEQRSVNIDGRLSLDDVDESANQPEVETKTYSVRIKEALRSLKDGGTTYLNPGPDGLQKLSPKFLKLLYNIENEKKEKERIE